MRIKEITASCQVRVNTGNFEGTERFVSALAELDELDDEHEAHISLNSTVEKMMVRQLVRSYKVRGIKEMDTAQKVARHHGLTYIPS